MTQVQEKAGGRPLTILVLTDRRFWRRSIGSEQRIASLLLHLTQGGDRVQVCYVGRIQQSEREQVQAFLEEAPDLELVDRSRDRWTFLRTLAGRLTGQPSPARRHFAQRALRELRPDVVLVEFLRLTYTVFPQASRGAHPAHPPHPLYLIDTHDVLHQRAERYRSLGAHVAQEIDADEEIGALANYDALLAIQSHEGALLRRLLPEKTVLVVPHGIDLPETAALAGPSDLGSPLRFGFLGGRDEANLDALDWFIDEVWSPLHDRHPGNIELHVAGQICQAWKPRGKGVRTLGMLDSIDDFWPHVDIAVNPVRFGSGLKIKNVEALAYGRALITTPIGAEGIEGASPRGLRIVDSSRDWLEALEDWIATPSAIVEAGRKGRSHAEARLSTKAAFLELTDYLDGVRTRLSSVAPSHPPTAHESAP